jgi:hypothetical protein
VLKGSTDLWFLENVTGNTAYPKLNYVLASEITLKGREEKELTYSMEQHPS